MSPETSESPVGAGLSSNANEPVTVIIASDTVSRSCELSQRKPPSRRRRSSWQSDFINGGQGLLVPRAPGDSASNIRQGVGRTCASEVAGSPRDAWVRWLSPKFSPGSAYFTGTYSDEYGVQHGLMLARNVHKDFRRFLIEQGLADHAFINGVEQHRYRDVLHLHGIIDGTFSDIDLRLLSAAWGVERGFARVLPVLDGCTSYVTKYALKGDTESFDWNLA